MLNRQFAYTVEVFPDNAKHLRSPVVTFKLLVSNAKIQTNLKTKQSFPTLESDI